jgi:transposase-like protein
MIEVRKYRHTRFWAVYVDGELLAVTVYRKGATAIANLLMKTHLRKEAGNAT